MYSALKRSLSYPRTGIPALHRFQHSYRASRQRNTPSSMSMKIITASDSGRVCFFSVTTSKQLFVIDHDHDLGSFRVSCISHYAMFRARLRPLSASRHTPFIAYCIPSTVHIHSKSKIGRRRTNLRAADEGQRCRLLLTMVEDRGSRTLNI